MDLPQSRNCFWGTNTAVRAVEQPLNIQGSLNRLWLWAEILHSWSIEWRIKQRWCAQSWTRAQHLTYIFYIRDSRHLHLVLLYCDLCFLPGLVASKELWPEYQNFKIKINTGQFSMWAWQCQKFVSLNSQSLYEPHTYLKLTTSVEGNSLRIQAQFTVCYSVNPASFIRKTQFVVVPVLWHLFLCMIFLKSRF